MIVIGSTHRVGDDIAATHIFDPAHGEGNPAVYAAYCLAAVDPLLAEVMQPGDILVAGANFGHGAGADAAATALFALEVGAVVCASAADTFVTAADLYGLPVIVSPEAAASLHPGTRARIDFERATVKNLANGEQFAFTITSSYLQTQLARAELLRRTRQVSEE